MRLETSDRVKVAESRIGLGVFASRRLRRGQMVGEIRGEITHGVDNATPYCIELDETRSLEPHAPFRFLNHCCEPNCEIYSWDEDGDRDMVYLQTLRTIQPGEELTIDYAWPADAAIRCKCDALKCRGWVVDINELDQLLATKKPKQRKKMAAAK